MLSLTEKIVFALLCIGFGGFTAWGFYGIFKIIRSGRSAPKLKNIPYVMTKALLEVGLQIPIFRSRPLLSIFHAFIFFGFSFYTFVNITDGLEGYIPGFELIYGGSVLAETYPIVQPLVDSGIINLYNIIADILSVLVLVGMVIFIIRRSSGRDKRQKFNKDVILLEKVKKGSVARDSYIVGAWMITHVGSRFLGQIIRLARDGEADPFMPFASIVAPILEGLSPEAINFTIHLTWWTSIGSVIVLLPYFIISKHFHLMVAPINLGLVKQNPRGQLDPAIPEGADITTTNPGAKTLHDLPWPRLLDAYACIMCNRCNDVCPAHASGWSLSPAALEINKRYLLNQEFSKLARGAKSDVPLADTLLSQAGIWECTTCYACVQVCPVGNEPMADIIDMRRQLLLDGSEIDSGIQGALESIAKNGNWFGKGRRARARWTKKLDFDIKDATKEEVEYLWFVGDTASFDERVIPKTQKFAQVLHAAGVDFGIMYKEEHNSGNDVRRAGEEGLFEQSVEENMKAFGKSTFKQIMTTDPHTLNTLRNEYPQYGGKWAVHHYTNILIELFEDGKLDLVNSLSHYRVTFHDPCYLGRYNRGYEAPRTLLSMMGVNFFEMPRNRENSYCCGAGGFQIAVASTPEGERPAENRIREAVTALGVNGSVPLEKLLFIVACPKDVVMYTDAVKTTGNEDLIEVRDIIDLVQEAIGMQAEAEGETGEEQVLVE